MKKGNLHGVGVLYTSDQIIDGIFKEGQLITGRK